jgi:hypothetical protein
MTTVKDFNAYREKMNGKILEQGNLNMKRFFALDTSPIRKVHWMLKQGITRISSFHGASVRRLYPLPPWQVQRTGSDDR